MAHPVGTKLLRVCQVSDGYIVPFNLKTFAFRNGQSMSDVMRKIGMPVANMNNWTHQIKGSIPLKVAKALLMAYEPTTLDAWEKSVQGQFAHKKPPCKVTDSVEALALRYDAKRAGAKLKLKDGSVLTITSSAAEAVAAQEERTRLEHEAEELAAADLATQLAEVKLAEQLQGERERAALQATVRQRFEVPVPGGTAVLEFPAQIPPGERELYSGLLIRLHAQLAVSERQKAAMEIRMRGLEGQIENMKARLHAVTSQHKELELVTGRVDAATASTVAGVTTPRLATLRDVEAARAAVKQVPELQQLIDDMAKQVSFPKGAAHVS